ncbi:MFS transporter [Leifsonia shinshuensis]|uniref:MFS transporter n=1 Tax=Leifsonia shinshuensis TaxID=150026 RepID=A0A7G6YBF4_9MICO|nr:hypothetical protein [Leifsonia shinshuensis]QNE35819.1 hypothetical protein F1C12_12230 [Leifsonia shinshuensis]
MLLPGVSLLFFGLLAGVLVAAVPGIRATALLPVGLALQGAGLGVIAFADSTPMFFVAAATAGVGFGFVEAGATTLARVHSSTSTPARLAWLNGTSAVAAACAPLLMAVVQLDALTVTTLTIVAVPVVGLAVALRFRSGWPSAPSPRAGRPRAAGGGRRRLLMLAAALFLFVGAETILSGWSSVLPQTLLDLSPAYAAVGTSVFWILMAGGRFLGAIVVRAGVQATSCFVVAGVVASALTVAAAFITDSSVSAVLLCVVVPLVAPGYALLLGSALTGVPGSAAGRTAGWLIATGSAGGAAISLVVAGVFGSAPTAVLSSVAVLLTCAAAVTWGSRPGPARARQD